MTTQTVPALSDLSEKVRAAHPNSSLPMALLAAVEPRELNGALAELIVEGGSVSKAEMETNTTYEAMLNATKGRNVSPALRAAAQAAIDAEQRHANHVPQSVLAHQVMDLRDRLARPMRGTAIVLSSLIIGGSVLGSEYKINDAIKNNTPEHIGIKPREFEKVTIVSGMMATILGGALGSLAADQLRDSVARRRARRIVAKETAR